MVNKKKEENVVFQNYKSEPNFNIYIIAMLLLYKYMVYYIFSFNVFFEFIIHCLLQKKKITKKNYTIAVNKH